MNIRTNREPSIILGPISHLNTIGKFIFVQQFPHPLLAINFRTASMTRLLISGDVSISVLVSVSVSVGYNVFYIFHIARCPATSACVGVPSVSLACFYFFPPCSVFCGQRFFVFVLVEKVFKNYFNTCHKHQPTHTHIHVRARKQMMGLQFLSS